MTDSISDAAKVARDSLFDRPDLNTPEAISNGPLSIDQITSRTSPAVSPSLLRFGPRRLFRRRARPGS